MQNKERDILASLLLYFLILLLLCYVPACKRTAHWSDQLIRPVILNLCIDVHGNLAAFMACQVLNRFGIYRRMNKIGNVSMPQLMGCYLKVQVVNHFSVMSGLLSQDRCDSMLYSFSIFIPVIAPFLDRPRNNILPKSLKLRVGCLLYTSPSPRDA